MKNTNRILIVLIAALFIFSCSRNDDHINLNTEDLANELKSDIDLNSMVMKNSEFSNLLISKLQEGNHSFTQDMEINKIMSDIGISKEYSNYLKETNTHIQNIRNRYNNLNILSEAELLSIINELSILDNNTSSQYLRLATDCDAQFQSDMQNIHNQYDNAVSMCAVSTFISGGLAGACFVYAVTNATLQTSVAIDRHTICTKNK